MMQIDKSPGRSATEVSRSKNVGGNCGALSTPISFTVENSSLRTMKWTVDGDDVFGLDGGSKFEYNKCKKINNECLLGVLREYEKQVCIGSFYIKLVPLKRSLAF